MKKYADRYFTVDPWLIREDGFNPNYSQVAESIFSLGNEYMGVRGYFEEGYSGESLQGSYVNGVYERRILPKSGYKGMLDSTEFMINTVDWLFTRLICNGETLDLARCRTENFVRILDLRTGLLTRSFDWILDDGTRLRVGFERFLSMAQAHLGGQRISVEVLEGKAALQGTSGLDFSRKHMSVGENLWNCADVRAGEGLCSITGTTGGTKQKLFAACVLSCSYTADEIPKISEKLSALSYSALLCAGETLIITKTAVLQCARNPEEEQSFDTSCKEALLRLQAQTYDELKAESAAWWENQWKVSDILIDGADQDQQGIRYCIFQMHQTLHTARYGAIIGAKGLTGEAYNGNTFWDSEVYCLPFYVFNNAAAAKSILQFRYDTLPQARERAAALDCKGAFYPIATLSGKECCDLWQHASLQLQASTAVMYGLQTYVNITGDRDFLYQQGIEMLIEICRMLASRGGWNPRTEKYGFYGVMGPDEFQMMVHNNAYTNFMAKKTFEYTLKTLRDMALEHSKAYSALCEKLCFADEEAQDWDRMADRMELNLDKAAGLFEQHDGYFNLPHIDIGQIPVEDFPLYSHWSYERIYRNDMLKQPDVLMFMLMYNSDFSEGQLKTNYEFYEPRCIHESSLSPSVHSILAQQLGKSGDAYRFFNFSTRMDLDNYNRNTGEGLHTTSIAGAWMNIVYGYGGLRSDGLCPALSPALPDGWKGYSFCLVYRGSLIRVSMRGTSASLELVEGEPLELLLYGKPVTLQKNVPVYSSGNMES